MESRWDRGLRTPHCPCQKLCSPPPESKDEGSPPKLKCELCGRLDFAYKFKRSKRFCSMACAKRYPSFVCGFCGCLPSPPPATAPLTGSRNPVLGEGTFWAAALPQRISASRKRGAVGEWRSPCLAFRRSWQHLQVGLRGSPTDTLERGCQSVSRSVEHSGTAASQAGLPVPGPLLTCAFSPCPLQVQCGVHQACGPFPPRPHQAPKTQHASAQPASGLQGRPPSAQQGKQETGTAALPREARFSPSRKGLDRFGNRFLPPQSEMAQSQEVEFFLSRCPSVSPPVEWIQACRGFSYP